jgi:hypothetical protein
MVRLGKEEMPLCRYGARSRAPSWNWLVIRQELSRSERVVSERLVVVLLEATYVEPSLEISPREGLCIAITLFQARREVHVRVMIEMMEFEPCMMKKSLCMTPVLEYT